MNVGSEPYGARGNGAGVSVGVKAKRRSMKTYSEVVQYIQQSDGEVRKCTKGKSRATAAPAAAAAAVGTF